MNIAFVYPREIIAEQGGVQRVTSVLADYFESIGINVFYLGVERTSSDEYISPRQFYLPFQKDVGDNYSFFLEFLHDNKISFVINQAGINPDISRLVYSAKELNIKVISVVNNSIMSGIKNFSSLYKRRARRYGLEFLLPLANISFINIFLRYLYKAKYQKHYKELYEISDRVVILSDSYRDELGFMLGYVPNDSVITIPNPVAFACREVNLSEKKNEVVFVGRVDCVYKQVDVLLEIWELLYQRFPEWELKIVGGDGQGDIAILADKLGLKNISFEGFQDPTRYYSSASIFCLTSSSESFGVVLIEAMRFGVVPFAFSSYDAVYDIIDSPDVGVLIEPFNRRQYADELSKLMINRDRREQMAVSALHKSHSYSVYAVGSKWTAVFAELS